MEARCRRRTSAPRRLRSTASGARPAAAAAERPLLGLATFALLAGYGVMRWATLISPAPTWRLLGLLGLAVLTAGAGSLVAQDSRLVAVIGVLIAALGVLAISGIPITWIRHLRFAVSTEAIGRGVRVHRLKEGLAGGPDDEGDTWRREATNWREIGT